MYKILVKYKNSILIINKLIVKIFLNSSNIICSSQQIINKTIRQF
jgi:hypothetical protein